MDAASPHQYIEFHTQHKSEIFAGNERQEGASGGHYINELHFHQITRGTIISWGSDLTSSGRSTFDISCHKETYPILPGCLYMLMGLASLQAEQGFATW